MAAICSSERMQTRQQGTRITVLPSHLIEKIVTAIGGNSPIDVFKCQLVAQNVEQPTRTLQRWNDEVFYIRGRNSRETVASKCSRPGAVRCDLRLGNDVDGRRH
ncbi:unnamed protein product [Lactuca saligna]|uniref:Uncharacterized protein n=1 Tax=Lactuca saligna TaxID=75948 RepID=A0AA35VZY2_LACSI|nr:unnamed protein product [Lactuca saligna]